jgi:hypothetical protein
MSGASRQAETAVVGCGCGVRRTRRAEDVKGGWEEVTCEEVQTMDVSEDHIQYNNNTCTFLSS